MRESFDLGNLKDGVPDTWAQWELLPGFLGFWAAFYQACMSPS